ncbi:hypothetical protein [Sphingosinicella sp. LY1275]|uniref:hypothetical protein n=1 Tax=Sphingosinicella sp. LY1275 TaxID=3095379 RepID=UPI002ADEBEF9|nr:hypothetical protein [Sphingosinicella sp. LY1275]MEA1015157.1 hypothetical protein [Sphingosinicella sp. LY1275]
MATNDVTTFNSPCLCGKGHFVVRQSMPDHPYARVSQIHSTGSIHCAACESLYVIEDGWSGSKPRLILREDVETKVAAEEAAKAAEAEFVATPQAKALIPKIAEAIDQQPSKAARHRLAVNFGLTRESYSGFCKGPANGASLVRFISGARIAKAGTMLNLPPDEADFVKAADMEISSLWQTAWNVKLKAVKSGMKFFAV